RWHGARRAELTRRLGQVRSRRADRCELLLELLRPLEVGTRQLAADLPFPQAQEELLRGLVVAGLGCRSGVELGQQWDQLGVRLARLARLEQVRAGAPVQLGIEVLG